MLSTGNLSLSEGKGNQSIFFLKKYLREREREREPQAGGGAGEGENLEQAPTPHCGAHRGA